MQRKLQQLLKAGILSFILFIGHWCLWAQGLTFNWVNQIGGSGNITGVYTVAADEQGNILVTGTFTGTVDFDSGPGVAELSTSGGAEAFLAKYDAAGNYQWAIKLADGINYGSNASLVGSYLTIDSLGNIYMAMVLAGTGDFDPSPGVNQLQLDPFEGDAVIAKYDAEGNYLWAKAILPIPSESGSAYQIAGLGLDRSGHIYFSGMFSGIVDFDPGPNTEQLATEYYDVFGDGSYFDYSNHIFIASFDTAGNYQWVKQIGSTTVKNNWSMALDTSGNIYLSGFLMGTLDFDPGPGEANLTSVAANVVNIFMAKYDAEGNYLSAVRLDGNKSIANKTCLISDTRGSVYLTGIFKDSIDLDPGPDQVLFNSGGANVFHPFLAKYDTGLNYQWGKAFDVIVGNFIPMGLADDKKTGNVFMYGILSGTVDFDPGPGTAELTTTPPYSGINANYDCGVASYDACGNYLWAGSMGGNKSDGVSALAIENTNLYIGGSFQDTADLNPTADSTGLIALGTADGFLLKMNISRDTLTATGCHGSFSFNDKTYTTSGVYFDTLTSSLGCDSIATLDLTIIPNPQLTLDNGTLTASNADGYQWLSCDANMTVPGANEQTYTPVISGSYAVITTTSGCTDTSECVQVEVTGVDELSPGNKILLYPNPTHDIVQIQAEQSLQGMGIRVVNAVGQTMTWYPNVSGKIYTLDMTAYASGMYYVEISKDGKALLRKKVTKL